MDLDEVSNEIREVLDTIDGLQIPPWGVEHVKPPAALVTLPDRVVFDETYGRGKDMYSDLGVVILVGQPEARSSRKNMAPFVAGAGSASVKQVLERHLWQSCESVTVTSADFDGRAEYAGVPMLAAVFHLDIIGKGA